MTLAAFLSLSVILPLFVIDLVLGIANGLLKLAAFYTGPYSPQRPLSVFLSGFLWGLVPVWNIISLFIHMGNINISAPENR